MNYPTTVPCDQCGHPLRMEGIGPETVRLVCPNARCAVLTVYVNREDFRQLAAMPRPAAAEPVTWTDGELARLRFARWLVKTGRLNEAAA